MKTEIHLSRFEACHLPARQREMANSSRWNGNFSTVPSAPLFFIAWKSNCRFLSMFPSTDPRFLRVSSIFFLYFFPLFFFFVVNVDSSVSLEAGYPAVTWSNSTGIYKFFQGSFSRIRTITVPFFLFLYFFLGNVRVYFKRNKRIWGCSK